MSSRRKVFCRYTSVFCAVTKNRTPILNTNSHDGLTSNTTYKAREMDIVMDGSRGVHQLPRHPPLFRLAFLFTFSLGPHMRTFQTLTLEALPPVLPFVSYSFAPSPSPCLIFVVTITKHTLILGVSEFVSEFPMAAVFGFVNNCAR